MVFSPLHRYATTNRYLVKTDTSVSPPTVSAPLKINYIKGMTLVTPIAAHMMNTNGGLGTSIIKRMYIS